MKTKYSMSSYQNAKKRLERLKRFYIHLSIYLVVNLIIIGLKIYNNLGNWDALKEDIFSFGTLSNWLVWGIILGIHAFTVFGLPRIIGYDWEERKIQAFMKQEQENKRY